MLETLKTLGCGICISPRDIACIQFASSLAYVICNFVSPTAVRKCSVPLAFIPN